MILQGTGHTLQRGNLAGERQYGIALSPKIYSMMSDRLYTDRIGSTVREVCSNAWDGQKMKSLATGKPMEPFHVTLPTELEPHFIVEDFGVGMPDEAAQDLYSTLGLSTKEDTNDQIGAFGLGSKSPFSVTDTFTVENTYEGETHYYMCFKTEKGLPSLLKTGSKVEDRPNGVKVIIPAPGSKYQEYKRALMKQLICMDPKPKIINAESFDFIEPVKLCENEFGYILVNAKAFGLNANGVYARMGMVLYPVDININALSYGIQRNFKDGSCIVLEFPIGALEPLPSREGLTYDSTTLANIKEQYNKFVQDYRQRLKADVEKEPTPLDAYLRIKTIYETTSINLINDDIYINGWPINDKRFYNNFPQFEYEIKVPSLELDDDGEPLPDETKTIKKGKFYYETYTWRDTRVNVKRDQVDFDDLNFEYLVSMKNRKFKFLLMDEKDSKYRVSRLKSVVNDVGYTNTLFMVYVNPLCPDDKLDFSEFIQAFENIHPGITDDIIIRFSEVPAPERAKRVASTEEKFMDGVVIKRVNIDEKYVMKSTIENDIENGLDEDTGDNKFLDNVFYVTANRNELNDYPKVDMKNLYQFAASCKATMIIVRKTGMNHIKWIEDQGIVELKTFIDNKMKDEVPPDDYKKSTSAKFIVNMHSAWFKYSQGLEVRKVHRDLLANNEYVHPFLQLVVDVERISTASIPATSGTVMLNLIKTNGLHHYVKDFDWYKEWEVDITDEFTTKEVEFNEVYPAFKILLTEMSSSYDQETCKVKYRYIVDYNKLNAFVAAEAEDNI